MISLYNWQVQSDSNIEFHSNYTDFYSLAFHFVHSVTFHNVVKKLKIGCCAVTYAAFVLFRDLLQYSNEILVHSIVTDEAG